MGPGIVTQANSTCPSKAEHVGRTCLTRDWCRRWFAVGLVLHISYQKSSYVTGTRKISCKRFRLPCNDVGKNAEKLFCLLHGKTRDFLARRFYAWMITFLFAWKMLYLYSLKTILNNKVKLCYNLIISERNIFSKRFLHWRNKNQIPKGCVCHGSIRGCSTCVHLKRKHCSQWSFLLISPHL